MLDTEVQEAKAAPVGPTVRLFAFIRGFSGRFQDPTEGSRNVALLASASGLGFMIPFALSPLWSRAYPVEYFAIAAIVQSVSGLFSGWTTLAYHNAIHASADDTEAFDFVCLSIGLVLVFSVLLAVFCITQRSWLLLQFGAPAETGPWLIAAPVILGAAGIGMVLDQWMARTGRLGEMAKCVAIQAIVSPIVPAIGLSNPTATNFILLSVTTSAILGMALRLRYSGFVGMLKVIPVAGPRLWASAVRRSNFPAHSLPSSMLVQVSSQLPILMLSRFFDTDTVGHFARAVTLLGLPIVVFGNSLTSAFSQQAGSAYRSRGTCRPELIRMFFLLTAIMTPYYLVVGYWAPVIYPWFYGDTWAEAGVLARALAPHYLAMAVVSPLSVVLFLGSNTRWDLGWQVLRLTILVVALWVGSTAFSAPGAVFLFSIGSCAAYAVYFVLSLRLASRD